MALILGSSLAKGSIFELSDYESAFHPWWDSLQDYIMYTSIIVGIFAFPTANSRAECAPLYPNTTSPAHHAFVNGYCTTENVPLFISYFPYLVFLGPAVLAVIEKFFTKSSSIGQKMNHFYRLLVEDTKRREGLYHSLNTREAKEVENVYNKSSTFFMIYTLKNTLQFLFSVAYVIWMGLSSNGSIFVCEDNSCDLVVYRPCKLAKVELTCLVSDIHFYLYILIIVGVLMLVYILANLFTLLWIGIRPLRKLGRFLSNYKRGVSRYYKGNSQPSETAAVLDVYGGIKSLDVEILMDLLAEKLGVEMSLRILTMIDNEFNRDWKPQPRENVSTLSGSTNVTLEFEEPEITRYIGPAFQRKTIFTARLDPLQSEKVDSQHQAFQYDRVTNVAEDHDDRVFSKRQTQGFFAAKFKNLQPGRNYRIILSSFLNGTVMGETRVNVFTRPEPPEDFCSKWKYDFENSDIQFRLEMSWSPANKVAKAFRYLVEVENSSGIVSSQTNREKFSMVTALTEPIKVRIWTVYGGGANSLQSEVPLDGEVESVPADMQALADHLREENPPAGISSYAYRLSLLRQVTKELKDLYEEVQKVASFSKSSVNNNNNEDEDLPVESQGLFNDVQEEAGLTEMDL